MNQRVTIYYQSGIGNIESVEAKLVSYGTKKWAQYSSAPYVEFIPKKARKVRKIQQSYKPSLLIVSGWGQPKPASLFGAPVDGCGCVVSRGRYSSCDPRWREDFDALMAAEDVLIIADYRGHDTHRAID